MTSKIAAFCVSLSLILGVGASNPAAASSPEPEAAESDSNSDPKTTINIVTDTADLAEEFRGQTAQVIDTNLPPILEAAGYDVIEGKADIVLLVRFTTLEGGHQYFGVHFEYVRESRNESAIDWVHCPGCSQTRLPDFLDENKIQLLAALDVEREALAGRNAGEETGDGDGDDPVMPPPVRPIGPLGGVGIGVAAVGIGVTIAGAVQWSRGRVPADDPTSPISRGRDYTRPGQILVGVGAGALIVGAVMLGVDLGIRAKRRRSAPNAQVIPVIGPQQTGLVLQGRF